MIRGFGSRVLGLGNYANPTVVNASVSSLIPFTQQKRGSEVFGKY